MSKKGPITGLEDEELLQRYHQTGEDACVNALFQRHWKNALGLCLYYSQDTTRAEDICQDVFIIALQQIQQKQDIRHFANWLATTVRHACFKELKAHKRMQAIFSPIPENFLQDDVYFDDESTLTDMTEEQIDAVYLALEHLAPLQRRCIILHYLHKQPYEQIAQHLSIDRNTVRTNIQNGRRMLRVKLA